MSRDEMHERLLADIRGEFGDSVSRTFMNYGMPVVVVEPEIHVGLARWLKDHKTWKFDHFIDITAVDYYHSREARFEVVVHLRSHANNLKLRIKTPVKGDPPRLETISGLFIGAGWPEREIFDLLGIDFKGHPRMERILSPDDFEGHPLRKDFPVKGLHRGSFPRGTVVSNKRSEPVISRRTKPLPADQILPNTPLEKRREPMRGEGSDG